MFFVGFLELLRTLTYLEAQYLKNMISNYADKGANNVHFIVYLCGV